MGININPSSMVGYRQNINFLGNKQTAPAQDGNIAKAQKSEGDTVVLFGKEVSKKKAIADGIVGAAVLAGVVAGAVYVLRGGSIGKATREANRMAKEAGELAEVVKKDINDVTKIFEQASNGGLKDVTIKTKDGVKVMEEMKDGKLFRSTTIESGLPATITKYLKGGKQDIIEISPSKQSSLFKGSFKLNEKTGKATWKKELESTISGTPTKFSKKVAKTKDGVITAAKRLLLKDGKPSLYSEKFEQAADGAITYIKGLTFEGGKPAIFVKNFKQLADGAITETGVKTFDGKKWVAKKA